jgi:hypothetical protein
MRLSILLAVSALLGSVLAQDCYLSFPKYRSESVRALRLAVPLEIRTITPDADQCNRRPPATLLVPRAASSTRRTKSVGLRAP